MRLSEMVAPTLTPLGAATDAFWGIASAALLTSLTIAAVSCAVTLTPPADTMELPLA
jgi:hypothetical protein